MIYDEGLSTEYRPSSLPFSELFGLEGTVTMLNFRMNTYILVRLARNDVLSLNFVFRTSNIVRIPSKSRLATVSSAGAFFNLLKRVIVPSTISNMSPIETKDDIYG